MSSTLTKLAFSIALTVLGLLFFVPPAYAKFAPTTGDNRTLKLAKYLRNHNSSLEPYAMTFVEKADKYGLDYRLLVSISGVESTFARNYIIGTHNIYGWGGGQIYFKTWEDGIEVVSQSLRENYINKGAKTPLAISYIYCPPSHFSWYTKVTYFMDQIEKTEIEENRTELASALPLTL